MNLQPIISHKDRFHYKALQREIELVGDLISYHKEAVEFVNKKIAFLRQDQELLKEIHQRL